MAYEWCVCLQKMTKNRALFSWNVDDHRIESLFAVCNQFVSDLVKARDDLHRLEIDREKRRKKRERKRKRQHAQQQFDKRQSLRAVQQPKRSIMDDVRARRRKNTALLEKVGDKLTATLQEKSKLIEAVNFKQTLPTEIKSNKIKRKMVNGNIFIVLCQFVD